MRENKFRAWDKLEKKFLAWQEIIDFCDFSWIFAETDGVTNFGTNRFIPEQFTGLHDKNGVEIYEGDIVCTPFIDPIFGDMMDKEIYYKQNWTVVFKDGSFVVDNGERLIYLYAFSQNGNVEVISNIHEKEN